MLVNLQISGARFLLLSGVLLFTGRESQAVESPALSLASFGTAGSGKDDTALIQKALDACSAQGKALRIPARKNGYRVGPLRIPSRSHVLLESGVVLHAAPGLRELQKLINIVDVRDVELSGYGAVLFMNKAEYKTGEYRHCVYISGSTNIAIKGLSCADAGGDGFYINGSEKQPFSENVTITGVKADRSKGQGMTVISARNLVVRNSVFASAPHYGIDIEPESARDRLERIRFEENVTEANAGDGVRICLSKLEEKSVPVSLIISRHRDRASGKSSLFATSDVKGIKGAFGTLLVDRFSSENAHLYGMVFSFWSSTGPSATVRDASILNANQGHATDDNVAVGIIRGGGGVGRIGNIKLQRISIRDTAKNPAINYYYAFADYSRQGFHKVLFSQPGVLSGARHEHPLGLFQGQPVDAIEPLDESHLADLWRRAEAMQKLRKKAASLVSSEVSKSSGRN